MGVITNTVCKAWAIRGLLNCRDLWYWLIDYRETARHRWCHAACIIKKNKNKELASRKLPSAATVKMYRPSPIFQTGQTQSSQVTWCLSDCGKILRCHYKFIQHVLHQSLPKVTRGQLSNDCILEKRNYLDFSRTIRYRIWADFDIKEHKMASWASD